MSSVSVSSKGQVVIPSDVRQRLGIRSGTRLLLTEIGGELRLRPEPSSGPASTVVDGRGMAGYRGKRVSLADMERAVREGAAEREQRSRIRTKAARPRG